MARQGLNWIAAGVALLLIGGSVYCFATRGDARPVTAPGEAPSSQADAERGARDRKAAALREDEAIERADALFATFLDHGPADTGAWFVKRLDDERLVYVAPHPTDAAQILMLGCASCTPDPGDPCAYPREIAVRLFFEAPGQLFASCYGLAEASVDPKDASLVDLYYMPYFSSGKQTLRRVTVDLEHQRVSFIQDQSRQGHVIRTIRYVGEQTGDWDPSTFDATSQSHCQVKACGRACDPIEHQLDKVRAAIDFPLLLPRDVPKGFKLIRAFYYDGPVRANQVNNAVMVPARLVSLLYSDGMALISMAIAPKGDMDLVEMNLSQMAGIDNLPSGCSTAIPEGAPHKLENGEARLIRVRSDDCRTVLRRDGISAGEGKGMLSVTLLSRNELPAESYLRMIASIESDAARAARHGEGAADEGADDK